MVIKPSYILYKPGDLVVFTETGWAWFSGWNGLHNQKIVGIVVKDNGRLTHPGVKDIRSYDVLFGTVLVLNMHSMDIEKFSEEKT